MAHLIKKRTSIESQILAAIKTLDVAYSELSRQVHDVLLTRVEDMEAAVNAMD
jgi:hypothetical protein